MAVLLKVCGIAVLALIFSKIIGLNNKSGIIVSICAFIITVSICLNKEVSEIVPYVKSISEMDNVKLNVSVLLKAVGISFITSICSEICMSADEALLSDAIVFAGKTEILLLSLPLIKELLKIAGNNL